ncbi:MAG: hypothetical protein HY673_01235 [Chloroflexi bacterium]|nr:hypothetical protein [Chloroflexota bacterium]
MGYSELVSEKIDAMGHRGDEMKDLWKTILDSFEREGSDGVTAELAAKKDAVQEKFDAALDKLDVML